MADLLECLLQIKGLRETMDRLSALVAGTASDRWMAPRNGQELAEGAMAGPGALDLLARLADLEIVHGAALRLILTTTRPVVPVANEGALLALGHRRRWSLQEALERFLRRRRDNLELLDGCTADDLARIGVHPVRRDMPLADLVALMLACDVEHVGEIRRALGVATGGQPGT